MRKQLKAFTILEMLVAMVVSSVVLSSSFFIYSNFSENLGDYHKHINNLGDVAVFNGILSHDMNLAKAVKKGAANDIRIEQEGKNVGYEWNDDVVLRITDNSSDTFHLPLKNLEINFMNEEQTQPDALVDEIKFTSMADGQEFIFYFEKKYVSDILVESEKLSNGRY